MKQFRLLLTLLTLLAVGSMNIYAETIASWKNQSLSKNTAVKADGGNDANKGVASISSSVALTQKGTNAYFASSGGGAKITINNLDLSGYSDISMTFYSRGSKQGKITTTAGTGNVTVTKNEKQYTISSIPETTTSLTLTYGATSGSFYFGTVVISGTKTATRTTPTFTIEDKTISLSEAANLYDMSTNLTINKGGSTGAITYSCSDGNVDVDGNTFYTETAGTYTINATMAADATYCEATTSFTITVSDDTPVITVTYDANGGTVSPASGSYTKTPLTLPTPTIDGCYTFDGWYTAKTGGTKVESPYTPTTNTTLYAHWVESTATYMAMVTQPDAATNCKVKISKDGITGVEDYYDDIACGTTIYLLGTPSKGYKGLTYTAKDDNKNNVTITQDGLKDASFTMPASNVDITATPVPCDAMDAPEVSYTSTANSLTFSWKTVAGATQYNLYLYYNTDGTSHANDNAESTAETSYTFTGLEVGHTYAYIVQAQSAIETCFTETQGTATVVKPYTITWSTPDGTTTTTVVPGDKVVLPTTTPKSCSSTYTNFVGWFTEAAGGEGNPSTTKPATQVTAETIPTGDATYYAVFSDATGGGALEKVTSINNGDVIYLATSPTGEGVTGANGSKDATVSSTISEWMPFTVKTVTKGFTLLNGTQGVVVASKSFKLGTSPTTLTFNSDGYFTFTASGKVYCLFKQQTYYRCYETTNIGEYTQFFMYKAGSSATGYISSCCNDPAVVSVKPAAATINLDENGQATTTVRCTQQGGGTGKWAYAVTPATATFDGTTFTATAADTYTLTATYTENCPKSGTATITVTKNPVFGTATIDQSTFAVSCGDTTAMNSAATITLGTNYNLTKAVTVTAPEGFLVSTNKTDKTKYAASVTLTPAASGSNQGKITNSIYVRAYSAIARAEGYSGNITLSGDEITTQTIAVSSTVTCQEYTLTLNDRGSKSTAGNYYAGAEVPQPADPTGVCTAPINYVFDGWATAEVAEGSTAYTKVSFPYTMPNANTTLYAVYKYTEGTNTGATKVKASDIVDGGKYYITATYQSKAYMLKAGAFATEGSDKNTTTFVAEEATEDMAWTFVKKNNGWSIQSGNYKLGTTNDNNGLSSTTSNSGIWTITTSTTTFSKLTDAAYKRNLALYQSTNWRAYTSGYGEQDIQLYSAATYYYTTSPACGPRITGTGDIAVTSAKGIWVEAVTSLAVSAQNLDKNEDGTDVTIAATSLTDGFTLKTQGTNGSGSKTVTLATGYSNSTYNANLTVVYTPTADNIIEEGKIALRVYKTGGTTTYATDTITVRGHSLPAEFVVAAKTTDGWVALPSDLGTGSSSSLKAPYSISVDNETHPTKATEAPKTAVYSAADRSTKNTAATGIRLKNANGLYLQGSTAQGTTNIWLSSNNSEQAQSWELRSSDFSNYFVRLQAAESGRYLSYDATQGKIGNYKQTGQLRLLPVEKTCVRYDAPAMDVFALKSSAVTLRWLAIEGATGYEYSMDNEVTWNDCAGITATATEVKWTLDGLTANAKYTLYVRVKVANGETNCSASDTETFTTTTCDDVPVDLWVSATANTATITWRATAATATIRIYADEQGATLVKTEENASSPCKIVGLEQNTHYYYQVLADGSCASAIANFRTESNEVSIVEWEKEAVIVDLNTEITGADEVSILVENQHTHGTSNQNIADDLFFSKYYEATGSVKLVAIYNGTKDTLSLKDMTIKIGTSSWTATQYSPTTNLSTFGKKKTGFIAPNEEIIIWTKGTSYDYSRNNGVNIVECIGDKMDASVMVETNTMIFGGQASIGLFRGTELIDIIGALDEEDDTKPLQGSCEKPSWGDEGDVWCGTGWNIEDPTQEIELSTNRCLLVRSNAVKSGKNAVTKNRGAFNTLTKEEWLGRQVIKTNDTGDNYKGSKSSCEGFAYVADFNYNDYYTTYDSVANLEIKGNRNEDGTYTIPVPKLDTMACTNLRLQLKKNGTILATREEKVPIIIDQDADTKNATFFGDKLTDEICKTCDVVIRDKAQLSHTEGGKRQFRDMYVYTGSSLLIPAGQAMSLDKVRMFATNDSVSYAIVNNGTDADAAISVKEVSHVKRIDGRYWYPFSLPYDCNIADIGQLNGQPLGVYGMDWGIKYYDGQRRQSDGNSETTYGEVSKYWTMMPEDGLLKAYTGYIIGLFVPAADEPLMKSVNFPPATESAYTESADSKRTTVTNWADNLSADKRHHGWNFVGSPYISLFGAAEGEGLYNTGLKMGCTDRQGEQQDKEHIYVSIPDGGNKNTYTQSLAEGVTLRPFTAYFVQAVDPTNGQSNTLPLTYSKTQRLLLAPQRLQETEQDILVELTLANGSTADNAGLWVGNSHTNEYEIGRDLTKMYSAASKPQLYTVAPYGKMAYQALPDAQAHAIPLGIYVPAKGDYTLSLNRAVSRVNEAQSVCLLYNGKVVADLLQADYTLSATGSGAITGYTLDIRRAPKVETAIASVAGDAPYLITRNGLLTIANLPAEAMVQVYDMLGRVCFAAQAATATVDVAVPQTGVYTVVVTAADRQYILKTLLH